MQHVARPVRQSKLIDRQKLDFSIGTHLNTAFDGAERIY
jgi:hypothetical protein